MPSAEETAHPGEDKGLVTLVVSSVMAAVGLLFVVLRLVSRRIALRRFTSDDYLVISSAVRSPGPSRAPIDIRG